MQSKIPCNDNVLNIPRDFTNMVSERVRLRQPFADNGGERRERNLNEEDLSYDPFAKYWF